MKNDTICRSIEDLPLVLKVPELTSILGIGRNAAYDLVRCGQIRSIRVGNRILIPRDAIAKFISDPSA